jgi:SAM-dependent methyltransferase
MIDAHVNNKKSPKYHVKKYLERIAPQIKGKTAIDVPAGNGVTSEILLNLGAKVKAFDLFPEYFQLETVSCERADIMERIPVDDESADFLVCQEGMEHFSDQLRAFKEFNRVLRKGGRLMITTPSRSNLAKKMSYLLFESETNSQMPPNEIDDIWMPKNSTVQGSSDIYLGHVFLVGLQNLRMFGKLTGFRIIEIPYTRLSHGSLIFLLFYPIIVVSSYLRYFKQIKKYSKKARVRIQSVYKEQLAINLNPKHLLDKHTFIVFEKEAHLSELLFQSETGHGL